MISDSVTLPKVPEGTRGDVKHVSAYLLDLMQFSQCKTPCSNISHSVIYTETCAQHFACFHIQTYYRGTKKIGTSHVVMIHLLFFLTAALMECTVSHSQTEAFYFFILFLILCTLVPCISTKHINPFIREL